MVFGIDTSGGVCSVALAKDGNIIAEQSSNNGRTHSATLVPMIDELLNESGHSLEETSLFAVANGPGSFTGLRIGAATAKGLSFSLDKPIVGVSTLAALSFNLRDFSGLICPIMDARRNEVYTGVYNYANKTESFDSPIIPPMAVPLDILLEKLKVLGEKVTFLGDGVPVYKDRITESAEFDFSFAPEELSLQKAGSTAIIGEILSNRGLKGPSNTLKLDYLRRPQAERERLGL